MWMISSPTSLSSRRRADRALNLLLWLGGGTAGTVVLLVFGFVALTALPTISAVGAWSFTGTTWNPTEGRFGLGALAIGSLLVTTGAVLIALPAGMLIGACIAVYAPRWIAGPLRMVMGVLAGMPSVVIGLWGLTVLVPLILQIKPPGTSLLAGSLVLALMILPIVALTTEASLRALPVDLWRSSAALGLSRGGTLLGVALPAARGGIIAGAVLAVGRALGETMAVLMVCGNFVQVPSSVFDSVRTLNAAIALEMAYATGTHQGALAVAGFTLLLVVTVLALLSRLGGKEAVYA
jgi:phosphate transport system permease protein